MDPFAILRSAVFASSVAGAVEACPKGPSHIARHVRKNRTRREAVGWGRGFVREVSSELRLSSKKIRHEIACLPPEVPRGRDKVPVCTAMDDNAVSPV